MAVKQTKVVARKNKKSSRGGLPFGVGDAIFIRTVTFHYVGRVTDITPEFIILSEASWVADDGRFFTAMAEGQLNEVERCPSWVMVGRGSIVDILPWAHKLPVDTK